MKTGMFVSSKGGSGKTTTAFNLAGKLALQNKKVLILDLDENRGLSKRFGLATEVHGTTNDIFYNKPVRVENPKKNIFIIPGSVNNGELLNKHLNGMPGWEKKLLNWIYTPTEEYNWFDFDYIFFDTHPNDTTLNKIITMTSDVIFDFITGDKIGAQDRLEYEAQFDLLKENKIEINLDTKQFESTINGKLYHIGSAFDFSKTGTQEYAETQKDVLLTIIPKFALIENSKKFNVSANEQFKNMYPSLKKRNKKLMEETDIAYNKMIEVLDAAE
ncbi:ParA family protein [Periweissella cryptocerci]|uniref:ParA family protein n=1 Tax=Periweissella cryptocerci TaxID=2506420 RepID=A0A4V1AJ14_9LACO|nr:ParA family protein [Periweissella cryptocerci]QBO37415.1 ParA family protein [Periweissella cryptocerci]